MTIFKLRHALLMLVLGCSSLAHAAELLRVADQKGGIRAMLEAAGELKNVPYEIKWYEFPAAAPLLEALNADVADVGTVGDAPLIFAQAAGARLKIIGVRESDPYGTAILVSKNSPLTDAKSLKGKTIGTGKGSIGHYIALAAIKSAGLTTAEVNVRFLTPVDAKTALANGSIDAWATWEPYTAMGETSEQLRVLVNGRGLWPGLGYLAATETATSQHGRALTDFKARVTRAQLWVNNHPDAYAAKLAALINIPVGAAKLSLTRQASRYSKVDERIISQQQKTADFYYEAKLIPKRLDVRSTFDKQFY